MSEKNKRKRRSFWEPESAAVKTWLDDQTDLGVSLQLIIVDAMRKYGNGDVIKAYLNQREGFLDEPVLPVAPRTVRQPDTVVQQIENESTTPTDRLVDTQSVPDVSMIQEPVEQPRQQGAASSEMDMNGPRVIHETHVPAHDGNKPSQTSGVSQEQEFSEHDPIELMLGNDTNAVPSHNHTSQGQEYDPIAIMMGDIGSRIQK